MLPSVPVRRCAALLLAGALAVAVPVATAGPAVASPQLALPAPTGPHLVGTTTLHLVDTALADPWVPGDHAELMVQLWYPASTVAGHPAAPYWPSGTARAVEKELSLPVLDWPTTDGHVDAPVQPHRGGWPVVLYAPGFDGERSETTAVVEDLASHGYVVATVDYVHDSGFVELPDGTVAARAIPDPTDDTVAAISSREVEARVPETGFVLDQLAALDAGRDPDHEHRGLPAGLRGALDLNRVGMFGQSNGGSTTADLLHVDPRIRIGVDLDGTLWTPAAEAGSDRPLMLFGMPDLVPAEASSWAEFRRNQRGPALQLALADSTHTTFLDFEVLIPQIAAIVGLPPDQVAQLVGTIDGQRAIAIERTYLTAWFDKYLRHGTSRLLAGPSPRFPEVTFTP